MNLLSFGLIGVIFIVLFCYILAVFVSMMADLISIAWDNVLDAMGYIFYPIGEWIYNILKRMVK